MASAAEVAYTLQGVALDLREDGRRRLDCRPICLEVGVFPQTNGSSRLTLGKNSVLVGVLAELSEPDPAVPKAGRITVTVSFGPGNSALNGVPAYPGGDNPPSWLAAALAPLYCHTSIAPALEKLCIVRGAQCWHLRVHAQVLCTDGCPLDAISLAIKAALTHTRVPKITVASNQSVPTSKSGKQADLDLDESLDESVLFDAESVPVYVTLCALGMHLVADCSVSERHAAGCALSVAINQFDEICAMRMSGEFGLNLAIVADVLHTARNLASALLKISCTAIDEAMGAAEARGYPHADGSAVGLLGEPSAPCSRNAHFVDVLSECDQEQEDSARSPVQPLYQLLGAVSQR